MRSLSFFLAATAGMVAAAGGPLGAEPPGSAGRGGTVGLVLPARRAPDPGPAAAPELPPGWERLAPITLQAVVERRSASGAVQTVRQTISRTTERLHVAAGAGTEWLFEQNPTDPRRAFGSRVDHRTRVIVLYDESDLRNLLGLRGWGHVLALGFDSSVLPELQASGRLRRLGTLSFRRYADESKRATVTVVWWSHEQVFPSQFTTKDRTGSMTFSVGRVRAGADVSLLRPPAVRFPAYRVVDVADWLEHDH